MIIKNVVILGSTGSIGTQCLDIIRNDPKTFKIVGLSAWSNYELFKKQMAEFKPEAIFYPQKRLKEIMPISKLIKVFSSTKGLIQLAEFSQAHLVINALSGMIGVKPSIAAVKSGKNLALANKESLVCAGKQLAFLAQSKHVNLIPIDSELTALFQLLHNHQKSSIEKVVLTCSGGPFLGLKKSDLSSVTKDTALKHPTWKMGDKTCIDSATLVNKGLEVLSAMNLFGLTLEQVDVVIHPQSNVHAFVYFADGTVIAQMTHTDMRIPISYVLYYPEVHFNRLPRFQLSSNKSVHWTFKKPDLKTFEGLQLAYTAARLGGKYLEIFCKTNERAVNLFMNGKIRFTEIYDLLRQSLVWKL